MKKTRNSEVLKSFVKYCKEHPHQRFWQCLRNWVGYSFVYVANETSFDDEIDTFYWEGRDG